MNYFRDRRGSAALWAPFLAFAILVFGFAMWERSRLTIIAQGGRDAVQSAITQVCADNYKNVYTGVREGYSGGYKLSNTSWTENITSSDILAKLDAKLGTSDGVKTSDGKMEYKISDLSVHVQNAPLAPTDTDGVQQFTGTATYTLTVPLAGAWSSLPPLEFSQEAKSGFSPQGEAAFGGGSDDSGSPVEGINLSESAMTLEKGDTDVVAASVVPDDAEDRKISWTSTDNNICKVSQTGAVTGVSVGSASVVALSQSGKMAQCNVTVISAVAGVSLDKTNVKLIKGASEQLNATVRPTDANNKNVQWATSDGTVCTVDSTGKITATGAGTTVVTVMTEEGGYFAECSVTVTIPVSGLTLDKTSLKMEKGAADILKATVYPSDATRPDVLWASSDDAVCKVDSTGNITAVGIGSAVISATTMDGQFEADCDVNVVIPVTGISLSPSSLTLIEGTSGNLTATVSPADATDKNITWVSSNPSVCTVDSSGRVNAVGVGSATVTVKTEDGGYTATASITVKPNTYNVTANCGYGGTVYGGGVYNAGSNVTLTAQPYEHYHFVNWTNSAGTVVGYSPTYTIYNLSADTTVTANFTIDTFTVNVYGSTGGTAYGSGTYAYGTEVQLRADASPGYHFNNWSDGNVANPRDYIVYGNANLTAIFAPDAMKINPLDINAISLYSASSDSWSVDSNGILNDSMSLGYPRHGTVTGNSGIEFKVPVNDVYGNNTDVLKLNGTIHLEWNGVWDYQPYGVTIEVMPDKYANDTGYIFPACQEGANLWAKSADLNFNTTINLGYWGTRYKAYWVRIIVTGMEGSSSWVPEITMRVPLNMFTWVPNGKAFTADPQTHAWDNTHMDRTYWRWD